MASGTTSWASSDAAKRTMQGNRSRDTGPELALRRELHKIGLRYRIHRRPVPTLRRTADIVFGPARIAVVVHGCFWHGCPTHYTAPVANAHFWVEKFESTRERDAETVAQWESAGWLVVTVWEHEASVVAAARIKELVQVRRH